MKVESYDVQKLLDLGYKPLISGYAKEVPDVDIMMEVAVFTCDMETGVIKYDLTRSGKKVGFQCLPIGDKMTVSRGPEHNGLCRRIKDMENELISSGAINSEDGLGVQTI